MDKNKTKSLNEQLLVIAESVEKMADAEIAVTEAYIQSLKDLKREFDEGVIEVSVAPTL